MQEQITEWLTLVVSLLYALDRVIQAMGFGRNTLDLVQKRKARRSSCLLMVKRMTLEDGTPDNSQSESIVNDASRKVGD